MPSHYHLDPLRHWLITKFTGLITVDEIRAHLELESQDGLLGHPEIIDVTSAQVTLTPAEVRDIVELVRQHARTHALGPAAVLVKDEFSYGMARMLEILIEDLCDVRPFRSMAQAEAWLRQANTRPGPAQPLG